MRRETPLTRSGVPAPISTAYGYISHSEAQTEWTLTMLRRNVPAARELSDDDIVWLLARGWQP